MQVRWVPLDEARDDVLAGRAAQPGRRRRGAGRVRGPRPGLVDPAARRRALARAPGLPRPRPVGGLTPGAGGHGVAGAVAGGRSEGRVGGLTPAAVSSRAASARTASGSPERHAASGVGRDATQLVETGGW